MKRLITSVFIILLSFSSFGKENSDPIIIVAHVDDQQVESDGSAQHVAQSSARAGESGSDTDYSKYVIPFQIPVTPVGEVIISASLKIFYNGGSYFKPSGAVQVYGIDNYRSYSAVLINDYDATSTLITSELFTGASPIDATYEVSNTAILDFINASIAGGAQPGDYIFFRLESIDNTVGNTRFYSVSSANNLDSSQKPTLTIETASHAPRFLPTDDITAFVGQSLESSIVAMDIDDNDSLRFSIIKNMPSFVTLKDFTDRTVNLSISNTAAKGIYTDIVLQVSDGTDVATDTISIEVRNIADNYAPVLNAIGNQEVIEQDTYVVGFSASDKDGEAITFSVLPSSLPSFMTFTDSTNGNGSIKLEPTFGDSGTYNITITVTDGEDTDEETIVINVKPYSSITNNHNGISIEIEGNEGIDFIFDRYYFDPLVNDNGLCYIKSDIDIKLFHNENNSRIKQNNTTEIVGGDDGQIRYKVDRDLQRKYWAGDNGEYAISGRVCYPAYNSPISFDDMEYEAGVPVVGTTGFNPGVAKTDRDNSYSRGLFDLAGNEYHYFTYADDDDLDPQWKNLEMSASDGKSMLFCVNPITPVIWLTSDVEKAEYYTTPAKTYWVPKIFEQTSYVTNDIDINLKNIMTSDVVHYSLDGGAFQVYSNPISSNTLSNGEHTLKFYYTVGDIQTRKIVKNPTHPSKNDVFEDGSKHGYILWKDEADFNRWKDRMLNGFWKTDYIASKNKLGELLAWKGNEGIRNPDMGRSRDALMLAIVPTLEGIAGNEKYFDAAKVFLLSHPTMHIEKIGQEVWLATQPNPAHELNYRGYYDDWIYNSAVFIYDLMAKDYTSDKYSGGLTPIEDLRIRDMLARNIVDELQYFGGMPIHTSMGTEPETDPVVDMWNSAHQTSAVFASLAMPSYNTNYYGTSGFDGATATHKNTPYPDYAESWKDIYLTYTDKTNSEHVSKLHSFPNRRVMFNWYDGGLITDEGHWYDRIPYADPPEMGHGIEMFYNVMRRKFNKTYPKLDLFMEHSLKGELKGNKFINESEKLPRGYTRRMMMNEYFPDLAPIADTVFELKNGVPDEGMYFYITKPYAYFFYNPNWENDQLDFKVESVVLNETELSININDTFMLEATVYPVEATDKTVSWSSDNENIATVDSQGNITPIAKGVVNITVTTTDGGHKDICIVTVETELSTIENDILSTSIWPNPIKVGESINISVSKFYSNPIIRVTDLTGKIMNFNSTMVGSGNGEMLIQITNNFKPGMYIFNITDGYTSKQIKLVVQ